MRLKLRIGLALCIVLVSGVMYAYADENNQQALGAELYVTNDACIYRAGTDELVANKAQWIEQDGKKYLTSETGEIYKNQFVSFGPYRYYLGADGAAGEDIFQAGDGETYNSNNNGEIVRDDQRIEKNGNSYLSNEDGKIYKDQFVARDGEKYSVDKEGAIQKGIFIGKDGSRYNASDTGEIQRKAQWIEKGGKYYYSNAEGVLYVNQFIKFGYHRYYMGKDGAAMTGVFKAPNNHSYNADETGEFIRKVQWIEQNGKRYFSNEDGEIYTNQFLYFGATKYFVGPDGAVRDDINFDGIDFGIRQSPNYNIGRAEKPIDYIVIHHWGHEGQSFSGVVCWLCRMNGDSSAHYVVQGGRVECIVNPNDTAWHAGNWNYNLRTIGIECRPEMTDGDFDTTARLIANLWKMYGKKPIIGHRDIIPTACPGKYYTRFAELTQLAESYYNK